MSRLGKQLGVMACLVIGIDLTIIGFISKNPIAYSVCPFVGGALLSIFSSIVSNKQESMQ